MVTNAMPDVKHRPVHKQTSSDIPPDASTWLDRNEVADMLGISVNTIQGLERRGLLNPRRVIRADNRGAERLTYIYNPKECAQVPRRDRGTNVREPGETAARCFELLDQGRTVREIIIELRELPEKIQDLREKWLDTGGADFVISPEAKNTLEGHIGSFANVAELVERVAKLTKAA